MTLLLKILSPFFLVTAERDSTYTHTQTNKHKNPQNAHPATIINQFHQDCNQVLIEDVEQVENELNVKLKIKDDSY